MSLSKYYFSNNLSHFISIVSINGRLSCFAI